MLTEIFIHLYVCVLCTCARVCFREDDVSLTKQNQSVDEERDLASVKDTSGEDKLHKILFYNNMEISFPQSIQHLLEKFYPITYTQTCILQIMLLSHSKVMHLDTAFI